MMSSLVPFTIILTPILTGCLFIFSGRNHERRPPCWLLHWLPFILIATLILAYFSRTTISYSFIWQPTAGKMSIGFERSTIILCLLVSTGFLFINHQTRTNPDKLTPLQASLMFFSYSFSVIALSADHFLLRFAALEFVGLCVVGTTQISSHQSTGGWKNIQTIFINFKLGDLAFLSAILLMQTNSGSFLISQSLEMALFLPHTKQILVTLGLLTAVWVKLSIWPLDKWVHASSAIPTPLRIWYADLLLPVLGAYLLYRAAPLLFANSGLAITLITLAITAGIIKAFNTMLKNQTLPHQRLKQIFSTICLIPLAALGQPDLFWALLQFWFIARLSYSVYILRHEHSPPIDKPYRINPYYVPSFLIHFSSFLTLLQISIANFLSNALLIPLWFLWWMIVFREFQSPPEDQRILNTNPRKNQFLTITVNIFLVISITLLICGLIDVFAYSAKGEGIRLIPNLVDFSSIWITIIYGFLPAGFCQLFLRKNMEKIRRGIQRYLPTQYTGKTSFRIFKAGKVKDPIDQTAMLVALFSNAAVFIYRAIEQNSIERISSLFRRFFSFLFNKVEKLTSRDLWIKILNLIIGSSQKIQSWHSGYLRLNMFLFILFIILLLIIVNQNFGYFVMSR